jgi:WD40 repeat protein
VAPRIEEALQSNELINVFQDDFEMLGEQDGNEKQTKITAGNYHPRTYSDIDYSKNKKVSCCKFHPTKNHLVALSYIVNMSFDDRAEISGKSFNSAILICNFADAHIITLAYVLDSPVEVSCLEFHPDNPNMIIGGCISGQLVVWDLGDDASK